METKDLRELLGKVRGECWHVRDGQLVIYDGTERTSDDSDIAYVVNVNNESFFDDDGGQANARLIALAPSLAREVIEARERIEKLSLQMKAWQIGIMRLSTSDEFVKGDFDAEEELEERRRYAHNLYSNSLAQEALKELA